MNTCRGVGSVDSKGVAGDIIGRAIFWQEAVELGADGEANGEENMRKGSTGLARR
jgi:hypothetical protein